MGGRARSIIIEPVDSHYRAYPLAVPEVEAQGETPQAAKEKVTEALRAYLAEMLAQGKPLPVERKFSRSQIAPAGFAIQRPSGGLQIRREQKCDLLKLVDTVVISLV